MEVQSTLPTKITKPPKKLTREEIQAKVESKFGKRKSQEPKPVKETVELSSKKGVKNSSEDDFGDIKSNNPEDLMTHEKLKGVLKSGGFQFSERERAALSKILK